MKTKKEDTDNITGEMGFEAIQAYTSKKGSHYGSNLKAACTLHNPNEVKHFLIANEGGELLYERIYKKRNIYDSGSYTEASSILVNALSKDAKDYHHQYTTLVYSFGGPRRGNVYKERTVKYGEKYRWGKITAEKEFQFNSNKEKELTIRLILQAEVARVKDEHHDWDDKQVTNQIIQDHYYDGGTSPLHMCARSGPNCQYIRLIIDELGAENISFDITKHENQTRWYNPKTPMDEAIDAGNYKMLEIYLTEYLKMKAESKDNPTLLKEIKTYITSNKYLFADVMRMFPENLANAIDIAVKEGANDQNINKAATEIEATLMEAAYDAQLEQRRSRRNTTIGLAFTIVGALPALGWYIYHRVREPLKKTTTSENAFLKYLSKREKSIPEPAARSSDEDSSGDLLHEDRSYSQVETYLKEKEITPPVKGPKETEEKVSADYERLDESTREHKGWRTRKVVKASEGKVSIFTTRFNGQSRKFDRDIRAAEREADAEARDNLGGTL